MCAEREAAVAEAQVDRAEHYAVSIWARVECEAATAKQLRPMTQAFDLNLYLKQEKYTRSRMAEGKPWAATSSCESGRPVQRAK